MSDFPAGLKQLDASHNQIGQWPEPATYWLNDALLSDGLAEERRCYAAGDTNKYIVSIPGEIYEKRTPLMAFSIFGGRSLCLRLPDECHLYAVSIFKKL